MNNNTVTTVLARAAAYDLVTLAVVKDDLSITTTADDSWLARAITQLSKSVMNDTNRVFSPEFLKDTIYMPRNRRQVIEGGDRVQLTRFPIIAVASVVQIMTDAGTTTTLTAGTDFDIDYDTGELIRLDSTTGRTMQWESYPLTVKYVAGYGNSVNETHSIPASPAYTITVSQASAFSCDQSVTYTAGGAALTAVASNPAVGQYSVNLSTGIYTFAAADAGKSLSMTYATLDVPDDIQEVCTRLVTGRYRSKGRDPNLIQRETPGLGTERFWFGGAPGQTGRFPLEISSVLDAYSVPVIA